MIVRVLGIDGGLATSGVAMTDLSPDGTGYCSLADVFTSEPRARKLNSELADDRVRRARSYAVWLNDVIRRCKPDVLAIEAMSFPKGMKTVIAISLGWGVISTLIEMWKLPFVTSAPWAWRRDLVPGGKEDDAHRAALKAIPSFADRVRGVSRDLQVHAYDALGMAHWSRGTNLVRALLMRGS